MNPIQAMQAEAADQVFAALGDATRRAISKLVARGPQSVSSLAAALNVTLTAISQHLRVLQTCGLLQTRKVGRVRMCELDGRGLDVLSHWVWSTAVCRKSVSMHWTRCCKTTRRRNEGKGAHVSAR
jgi:DNA-binding transcriptional ArsR family regulator